MATPTKHKAKDDGKWSSGWWDFHALTEHPRPPVQWSSSSIIFTAHPTLPQITARHFSSSKQFILPSPNPILNAPQGAFAPPTVISVSPSDEGLFAYFPGNGVDGIAALYLHGPVQTVDHWMVREWWSLAPHAGVVAAAWLGTPRENILDSSNKISRAPPRGPQTTISTQTLLVVSQNHRATLCYFRNYVPTIKMMSCSLEVPCSASEANSNMDHESSPEDLGSARLCVYATIGKGYNESSVIVATRSHIYPQDPIFPPRTQFDLIGLDIPETHVPIDEPFGEVPAIDLCEVRLGFEGGLMKLITQPISRISTKFPHLSSLSFISEPKGSSAHYLLASFLDFDDFISYPRSEIIVYSIARKPGEASLSENASPWKYTEEAKRTFNEGVISFVISPTHPQGTSSVGVFVGISNTGGILKLLHKPKLVQVGYIRRIKVSDLTDMEDWNISPIVTVSDKAGSDVPISLCISPNEVMVAMVGPSFWTSQISYQTLPRPKTAENLSDELYRAILLKRDVYDITHLLPLSDLESVTTILHHVLTKAFQRSPTKHFSAAVGVVLEVHKNLVNRVPKEERDIQNARWATIQAFFSLFTVNSAFDDCRDGDKYDLEASWHLIAMSAWVIRIVEELMRECILSYDMSSPVEKDDLFGSRPSTPTKSDKPLNAPIFVLFAHPLFLKSLINALKSVNKFRTFIDTIGAPNEKVQLAKQVLTDVLDCSGIAVSDLISILDEFIVLAEELETDDCLRSLASCQPTSEMQDYLRIVVQKLAERSVLDKARLFVKPGDLIDGINRLSIDGAQEKETDIVSKATLGKAGTQLTCVRCGGHREIPKPQQTTSAKWFTWERGWSKRCICGAPWMYRKL